MIRVRVGELAETAAEALIRPVATDFGAVTPAMRRLDDAAGPAVRQQYEQLGELPLGSAVITAAGDLPAKFLVHVAVRSPSRNPGPGVVRRGLENALRRLADWGLDSAALAPLGTGAGNLDAEEAAEQMVPVLVGHLAAHGGPTVEIVVEDEYQRAAFEEAIARHGGGAEVGGGS